MQSHLQCGGGTMNVQQHTARSSCDRRDHKRNPETDRKRTTPRPHKAHGKPRTGVGRSMFVPTPNKRDNRPELPVR